MSSDHKRLFERYVFAGAMSHDPDAVADLFTEDGVFEAPLLPPGHFLPRRLEGREAIRAGIGVYHHGLAVPGEVNVEKTGYVLHDTADPDTFIAEIDTVFDTPSGESVAMSLVQIFRVRDGQIAMIRDYFRPPPAEDAR